LVTKVEERQIIDKYTDDFEFTKSIKGKYLNPR
jgi:hypothetical protein